MKKYLFDWLRSITKEARYAWMEFVVFYSLARSVRINRESRGWTQAEFGERCGMAQSYVSRLEHWRGAKQATIATWCRIAAAFDCAFSVQFCAWGEWVTAYINPDGTIRTPKAALDLAHDLAFLARDEGTESV